MRSMELPGVIFFPYFWHFRVSTVFAAYPNFKKKKKKKDFGSLGTYLTLFVCTLVRPVCWQYCCPCFLDENCGFQLLGDEPSKSSIMSN